MKFADQEILELKAFGDGVTYFEEGGVIFFLISKLRTPAGCSPEFVDALLCPSKRDGYSSRLFFAERLNSPVSRNWNASSIRIGERLWHACSWKIVTGIRLTQMVAAHLEAFR